MSMTHSPSGPVPHYRVLGQIPGTGADVHGNYGSGMTVTAALDSGSTFRVFVPDASYNPANVKAMLDAKATQVAAIEGLGG